MKHYASILIAALALIVSTNVFAQESLEVSCSWTGFPRHVTEDNRLHNFRLEIFQRNFKRGSGTVTIVDGRPLDTKRSYRVQKYFGPLFSGSHITRSKWLYNGDVLEVEYIGQPLFRYYVQSNSIRLYDERLSQSPARSGWSVPKRVCYRKVNGQMKRGRSWQE